MTTSEHVELGDLISGDGHAESRVERLTGLVASLMTTVCLLAYAITLTTHSPARTIPVPPR